MSIPFALLAPWASSAAVVAAGDGVDPLRVGAILVGLLLSVAWHESAHAWTAMKLGDPTGKILGRVTLNPIPHIDLFGSILLPLVLYVTTDGRFTFGYAKPVPYNPFALKNPVVGSALIAAAGPVSNLILGFLLAFAVVAVARGGLADTVGFEVLLQIFMVNVFLAVFNLFPVPPLDGSKVFGALLPRRAQDAYFSIEPYGFMIVMLLIATRALDPILYPVTGAVIDAFLHVASAVLG